MNRPFFSIIIPCYNSEKTIGRLLNSIVMQNMQYGQIEVIISDDCSTQDYQHKIDIFKQYLLIKQTKTNYNCCPGNTRQKGVQIATGEWICFADHDDQFVQNVLPKVKKIILDNDCKLALITNFEKVTLKGQIQQMSSKAGWTHGKFFNLDNFWNKYNIHYIKDMKSHEDVCIISQLNYLQKTRKQLNFYEVNLITYKWYENKNSLTNRQYSTADGLSRTFIDAYFTDYFRATIVTYYRMYIQQGKRKQDIPYLIPSMLNVILFSYFYLQYGLLFAQTPLRENYDLIKMFLDILLDQFNITTSDINYYFTYQNQQQYEYVYRSSLPLTGIFLCQQSFGQWLFEIANEKYLKA